MDRDTKQNCTLNPLSPCPFSNVEYINSDDSFYEESEVKQQQLHDEKKKFSPAYNQIQIELIEIGDDWVNQNVQYAEINQNVDAEGSAVIDLQRTEHVNCMSQIDSCQIELIEVDEDWAGPNVQYSDVNQTDDDDSSVEYMNVDRQDTEDVNCMSRIDDCQIELIEVDDDWVDQNVQYSDTYQSSDADSSDELMNFEMPSTKKVDCMNVSDDCQVDLIEVNDVYVQCTKCDNAKSPTRSSVCSECSNNEITLNFEMPVDSQIRSEDVKDNLGFDDQLERKGSFTYKFKS